MQERHTDYERYFCESEESCQKYYLPYLGEHTSLAWTASTKVLEVGCGLGGNLAPFARTCIFQGRCGSSYAYGQASS